MLDIALEFAAVWAAAYVIGAAIMFSVCLGLIQINKRHPERKIQTRRDGDGMTPLEKV